MDASNSQTAGTMQQGCQQQLDSGNYAARMPETTGTPATTGIPATTEGTPATQ